MKPRKDVRGRGFHLGLRVSLMLRMVTQHVQDGGGQVSEGTAKVSKGVVGLKKDEVKPLADAQGGSSQTPARVLKGPRNMNESILRELIHKHRPALPRGSNLGVPEGVSKDRKK